MPAGVRGPCQPLAAGQKGDRVQGGAWLGFGTEGEPCAGRGLAGLQSVVVQVADVGLICGHRGQVAGPHPAPSLGASTDGSVHGDHGIPGLSCLDRAAAHKTIGHVTVFLGCRVVRGQW